MRTGEREGGMGPPKLVMERKGEDTEAVVMWSQKRWADGQFQGGGVYTRGYTKRQLCVGTVSVYNHEKTLPNSKNVGPPANSPIIHKALTMN